VAVHNSTIIKFADDTMVVGLITIDDETANREEVSDLAEWCQDNNLSLKVSKTKVLIVDYRKQSADHAPMHIDRAVVERVESFKLLSVHITPLPSQESEKFRYGPSDPQKVLQVHH
jgi:hypothetical protein